MKLHRQCFAAFMLAIPMVAMAKGKLEDKAILVNAGMDKDALIKTMGPPQNRQFSGRDEAWQWCQTGWLNDSYVVVWMYDGVVTGLETYRRDDIQGMCNKGFKSVKWEDAPDRTIEIRER